MSSIKNRSSKPTDFRKISSYDVTSMSSEIKETFKQVIIDKSLENYKQVGRLSHARFFYKYINLENALKCISNGNILFSEPSAWQDNYEKRFYEADYNSQTKDETNDCPLLFATCMTTKRSNEAAWILYTYGKSGDGAFCVEFQLNKHKLRLQLVKALENNDRIYEGIVMYQTPYVIDNMHLKKISNNDNPNYHNYVVRRNNIPYITNYLNLLLMKRDAFQHENETRFYIVKDKMKGSLKSQLDPKTNRIGQTILLKIDWIEIIEKVYINAKDTSDEYERLSKALKKKFFEKCNLKHDSDMTDEQSAIWDERLKPVPYFVYGEPLGKPLVME